MIQMNVFFCFVICYVESVCEIKRNGESLFFEKNKIERFIELKLFRENYVQYFNRLIR